MIVFINQTTHLIYISAALKISCDGCLFLLGAYSLYCIYDITALKRKK
jgi:hypothetical protein